MMQRFPKNYHFRISLNSFIVSKRGLKMKNLTHMSSIQGVELTLARYIMLMTTTNNMKMIHLSMINDKFKEEMS